MRNGPTPSILVIAYLAAALLVIPPSAAQEYVDPQPPPPASPASPGFTTQEQGLESFGTNGGWIAIHASSWLPFGGTEIPSSMGDGGYFYPSESGSLSSSLFLTQLHLPLGAAVDQVKAPIRIKYASSSWNLSIYAFGAFNGSNTTQIEIDMAGTTSIGYSTITLSLDPPVMIHEWTDLDGDGRYEASAFVLTLAGNQDSSGSISFWGALVHWTRTISPAPATATFPDVPTSHWAFQYVEALAASGITQGYPDGTFKPATPVTRAQMATFLARALGLHWSH